MRHLSRDENARRLQAEAMLAPDAWRREHLRATVDRLRSGFARNMSAFDQRHGDGAYTRLTTAFDYASWRLEHQGVIHPDDLAIVEAYNAIPHFTGTARDDAVDFDTPRARLTLALAQPLCMNDTPRDPNWRGDAAERKAA